MKLTFLGAAHEVTGSCILLSACGKNFLIDYGMEQGRDIYENQPIPTAPGEIDGLFLTHAHIDHSGLIPLLYKNGFRGPVWCTQATRELCSIMLRDSAHIQEFEAEWRNRKAKRSGAEEYVPLYTTPDAIGVLEQFEGMPYGKKMPVAEGVEVRFTDAGHLLGSASIEIWVTEEGVTKKLVFSGDIGNLNQPLLRDPQYLADADYVVMESTYGDRSHGPRPNYTQELAAILQETFDRGGNVVIPSFAVGRTQEMLYFLRHIKENHMLNGHQDFPVFVDSPLAIEATRVFKTSISECFDQEALDLVNRGINPIAFDGLNTTTTADESRAINFDKRPKVILSASGMCEAGRIRHHLKHNLWRPESTILFVGYQSNGTLGRALVDGATQVKLFGEPIEVRAQIRKLAGVSGHADNQGLMRWIGSFDPKPAKVFVVHGEDSVTEVFSARLRDELGLDACAPFSGAEFDLAQGTFVRDGLAKKIERTTQNAARASSAFQRLVEAGKRLMAVIQRNEGTPNKDLARFASQIQSLCDKWDR